MPHADGRERATGVRPRRVRGNSGPQAPVTSPTPKRLDGAGEAKLNALRLGKPPAGFGRWTLRLLADQLVELEVVDSISPETVHQTLKKTG